MTGRKTIRTFKFDRPSKEEFAKSLYQAYSMEYEVSAVSPLPLRNIDVVKRHCNRISEWLTDADARPSLMILGGVGTGKTTMLRAIRGVLQALSVGAIYVKAYDLPLIAAEDRDAFELMRSPKAPYDFLLIDDVGEEPSELNHYGNKVSLFSRIIEGRYDYRLPTIITSNLSFASNDDRLSFKCYGERVYDRMKETFNSYLMTGDSYRAKVI